MKTSTQNKELKKAFTDIRILSFEAKKEALFNEEKINAFLDAINDFKSLIKNKTETLSEINKSLEQLTWLNDLNEEELMVVNDIIVLGNDFYSTLMKQYSSLRNSALNETSEEGLKNFKIEIDNLKESCEDLDSVFFYLPSFSEFNETEINLRNLAGKWVDNRSSDEIIKEIKGARVEK